MAANIYIICQECEEGDSAKYCENCGQYLCEKCSYKIHNKGKRAKHSLDKDILRNLVVRQVAVLDGSISPYLKAMGEEGKTLEQNFVKIMSSQQL
jgi:hypothetical protein